MKKYKLPSGIILLLILAVVLNACKKDVDPIVDELDFNRAFAPVELTAQITNVTTVTLSWVAAKNIDHYVVELYQGVNVDPEMLIYNGDIESNNTSFVYLLPAGDTEFFARIKAVSSIDGVEDSKWSSVEFKSGPENLFNGYTPELIAYQSIVLYWTPGKEVTDLVLTKGGNETVYPLTPEEIESGEKTLVNLIGGLYEIRIKNNELSRGVINYHVEGDIYLDAGDDLTTVIDTIADGSVIVLADGQSFGLAGPVLIDKSLKIRAINNQNPPVIYVTLASAGLHMFNIDPSLNSTDSLVFKNVVLSGFPDDNSVNTRIRSIIDQDVLACTFGSLKFADCTIRNFNRNIVRLRVNTVSQSINNVEFNNCLIYDLGNETSSYGVVSANNAAASFQNISFLNSTIYDVSSFLVLYQNGTSGQSVRIENCTMDSIVWVVGTTNRYLIDLNNTTLSQGVIISNCIIGNTNSTRNLGIRPTTGFTVTNSFYTSDYMEPTSTLKTFLTPYTGLSTDLWYDPLNGDFSIKDGSFSGKSTAGDPRWRP